MRYTVRHSTSYLYTDPVPVCHNLVHLAPRQTAMQVCREYHLLVDPVPASRSKRRDYFGNEMNFFSIEEAHDQLTVTATSVVDVAAPLGNGRPKSPPWESIVKAMPEDRSAAGLMVYQCSLPSPRVAPAEALKEYALPSFEPGRPVFDAVRELTTRIHDEFKFDARATTVHTRPEELLELRRGVCQDFAHLAIGALRSLGLSARYVSGYVSTTPPAGKPRMMGADASHAWLSAYCGPLVGWVDFDPTNDTVVGESHITIGWGRDYGDACPIQGVFVGGGHHGMSVGVDVVPQTEDLAPQTGVDEEP